MPPSEPQDALFFALLPDPDVAGEILALAKRLHFELDLSGPLPAPERLPVSLTPVGAYENLPDKIATLASKAAGAVRAHPFEITCDHLISFVGDQHPLVLTCDAPSNIEVQNLYRQLNAALVKTGLPRVKKTAPFPHLTLLYGGRPVPRMPLDPPISWIVRELVLVNSHQGKGRHEHVASWPLR